MTPKRSAEIEAALLAYVGVPGSAFPTSVARELIATVKKLKRQLYAEYVGWISKDTPCARCGCEWDRSRRTNTCPCDCHPSNEEIDPC